MEGVRIAPRGQPEQVVAETGVFIHLRGNRPITEFLHGQLPAGNKGCVDVDDDFQASVPGVYAVDDVLCRHVKQPVVAAAEGAVAAMAVERHLHNRRQLAVDWAR